MYDRLFMYSYFPPPEAKRGSVVLQKLRSLKNRRISQFLGFISTWEKVQNESESVTEVLKSQLSGGLFIPLSHLSSRPSDVEDKAALMSLRLCCVPSREVSSGKKHSEVSFCVLSLWSGHLNEALLQYWEASTTFACPVAWTRCYKPSQLHGN